MANTSSSFFRLATSLFATMLLLNIGTAQAQAPDKAFPPLGGDALKKWLETGDYKSWQVESSIHESQGPHFGRVRAYLNPVLFESMNKENDEHPVGSIAVKELYESGDTVKGWAVAIKNTTQEGGGSNWYWYENYKNETIKDGQGVFLCKACHIPGRDYVLTPFPLK